MDSVLISVLVPAYNVAPYLPECLDSILAQSERRIEVLVVDDGSTDGTGEILARHADADRRIRVFRQDNRGVAAARNRLLEEARGEWLYFCDADDKLAPGALARLLEVATTDGLDAVFFGADVVYESEDLEARFPKFKTRYSFACDMAAPRPGPDYLCSCMEAKEWRPLLWSMFFRRDLARRHAVRFLPDNIHEDSIFILELLLHAGRVARIADRLYWRRLREGSIMTTSHPREDFVSYAQNALRSVSFMKRRELLPMPRAALGIVAATYLRSAEKALDMLGQDERTILAGEYPFEAALAESIGKMRTEDVLRQKNMALAQRDAKLARRDAKIDALQRQIKTLLASRTYRLGKAIMAVPRFFLSLMPVRMHDSPKKTIS